MRAAKKTPRRSTKRAISTVTRHKFAKHDLRSVDSLLQPSDPAKDYLAPREWAKIATAFRLSATVSRVGWLWIQEWKRERIARELGIRSTTVKNHVRRLYERLSVANKYQFALRLGRIRESIRARSRAT